MTDQMTATSWWPTRKWWAGLVGSVAALVSNIVQADHWSREFGVAIVTVIAGSLTAYIVPNTDTPGGYGPKPTPAKRATKPLDRGRDNVADRSNRADDRVPSDAAVK